MAKRRLSRKPGSSAARKKPPSAQAALLESLESRTLLSASAAPTPAQIIAQSDNQFAFDLFHELATSSGTDNVFFSPYSIATALQMTLQGANGNTAAQMIQALHLPSSDIAQAGIQALYQLFQADPATAGYTLSTANRLWVNDNFQLLQSFLDTEQNIFGAAPQSVDFSDPVAAAATINQWVSDQTNGKIQNLIPPEAINGLTRLILTNAIYFKGTWQYSFNSAYTQQANFTTTDAQITPVQMMFQNNELGYYAQSGADGFQAIDLPYEGDNLDMLVILPTDPNLSDFDASLTPDLFNQITSNLQANDVNLYLPRFQLTETYHLVPALEGLGITDAFGDADFSGITATEPLQIADVIHKSFIQVDEQGSEAAGATAVIGVEATCYPAEPPPPPLVFDANHPFIIAIRDRATGTILFMGQVADPGDFTDGETPNPPIAIGPPAVPITSPIVLLSVNPVFNPGTAPPASGKNKPIAIHAVAFTPPALPATGSLTPAAATPIKPTAAAPHMFTPRHFHHPFPFADQPGLF